MIADRNDDINKCSILWRNLEVEWVGIAPSANRLAFYYENIRRLIVAKIVQCIETESVCIQLFNDNLSKRQRYIWGKCDNKNQVRSIRRNQPIRLEFERIYLKNPDPPFRPHSKAPQKTWLKKITSVSNRFPKNLVEDSGNVQWQACDNNYKVWM